MEDFEEDFEDIPAADDSMTAEEREVEIQVGALAPAALEVTCMRKHAALYIR